MKDDTGGPQTAAVHHASEATLHLDGAAGTVVLKNGRTTPVLTPAIYLLDPLGVRVDAVLPGARSIPPESSATLAVRFPSGTATATTGLFFGLEFGGRDAGDIPDVDTLVAGLESPGAI